MQADPADSLPLLVDPERFARELSIARRTLDKYISEGLLPRPDVKLNRKTVRWRSETVRAAIAHLAGELTDAQ